MWLGQKSASSKMLWAEIDDVSVLLPALTSTCISPVGKSPAKHVVKLR